MALNTSMSDTRSLRCCMEHLQRMGHGVISGTQFLINGAHCVDGKRARCKTCKKTWVHVCDESEGCSWVCATK